MSKRSSKSKRRSKALPALGFAGVSLSMASGACASTSEASANTSPTSQRQELVLGEEEIFDTSLSTFYTFDKENAGQTSLAQHLKLARGGCGGCGPWRWLRMWPRWWLRWLRPWWLWGPCRLWWLWTMEVADAEASALEAAVAEAAEAAAAAAAVVGEFVYGHGHLAGAGASLNLRLR